MAPTGSAVLTGAIINIVTVLIAFTVFSILRKWRKSCRYYDSKRYTPAIQEKPFELPPGLFSWILPTYYYPEQDIIRQCGLDTAIFLRLPKFGLELFLWASLWCLITVLPTNVTDNETSRLMSESDNYKFSNFDKLSLANVQPGSHRMWVHMVTVYVISILTLRMLWRYSKEAVLLRIQYLANSPPNPHTRTVLVTDIPCVTEATKAHVAAVEEAEERRREAAGEPKPLAKKIIPTGLLGNNHNNRDGKLAQYPASPTQVLLQQTDSAPGADVEAGRRDVDGYHPPGPMQVAGLPTDGSVVPAYPVGPAGGVGPSSPGSGTARKRKVYNYDLSTTSLDPEVMARRELETGATPKELVWKEFSLVYDAQLADVQMVHDQSNLTKLVNEYEKRTTEVEDYLDACQFKSANNKPLKEPKVTLYMPDAWCKERYGGGMVKKVPAFPFWRDRLQYLEEQISMEQQHARHLLWPSAFVTFRSRVAQSVSATGMQHHDERMWRTQNAPEPRELLWYNLGKTVSQRTSGAIIMTVLFVLMTLFYSIPVGAIQGLIDVNKLSTIPGLDSFLNNAVVSKLLQAIVPGLVLVIFLAILPFILATMMKKAGAVSESQVDLGVVSRFYIFQVIVVFFGNVLASSFFSQADQWIHNPTSVVSVLGTAIPQASTFFITYVFVRMGVMTVGFIRIVGVLLWWAKSAMAGSPRVRERLYQEQYMGFGTSCAWHTMMVMLGIVFCCINPIITPVVFVYFVIANIVEKYNNIFVYRRKYESCGRLWAILLNEVMAALYIFQLTMIGLISIKKFPYSPLMIPMLLISIGFHVVVLRLFKRPWRLMSLHDAAELDINDRVSAAEKAQRLEATDDYVAPAFKVRRGDSAPLLQQLAHWEPRVQADLQMQAMQKGKKRGYSSAEPATPTPGTPR